MAKIDFWFSIGSTYSYLTVMRLPAVAKEHDVAFEWRPYSVRALMQEMNNLPFAGKPAKEKHMWRDLERRAERHGIDISLPVEYPLAHFDLANRVAIVARQEGWCEPYVTAAYKCWFQDGMGAGSEANLEKSLAEIGQSLPRVLDLAQSEQTKDAYEAATDEARSLGIFGSPTFVTTDGELFWGDDRLEDALWWSRRGAPG